MLSLLALTLAASAPSEIKLTVDGVARSAIVYAPSAGAGKHPVVMAFHGHGGNARYAARQYDLQALWPEAYIVYGQGLPSKSARFPKWDGGNGWQLAPGQEGDRDVHYVGALLDLVLKKGDADPQRMFYIGHSNGSGFAWVVLKELGSRFSAFAGLCGGSAMRLDGAPLKPAFVVTGSDDPIVRPQGVRSFARRLADHNGCSSPVVSGSLTTFPGAAPVYLKEYTGGHKPPASIFSDAIQFFKTGRIEG